VTKTPRSRALSITAFSGLLGAVTLFGGDMLLYGHFGSGSEFDDRARSVIANASTTRLYVAGLLGPIAALLYLPGSLHVYWRLTCSVWLRCLTAGAFATTFVVTGAVHAVWGAYALVVRVAEADPNLEGLRLDMGAYSRHCGRWYRRPSAPHSSVDS
jgi:hypothetical protein